MPAPAMHPSHAQTALGMLVMLACSYSASAGTIQQSSSYQSCMAAPHACTVLSLIRHQLTGTIPSELGTLTNLVHLDLKYNELTGTIPCELAALSGLTYLEIAVNQLVGSIPSELGSLTGVTRMSLGMNNVTGTIPSSFAALTSVGRLYLKTRSFSVVLHLH
mmetsp:Transcript_35939/g.68921  ORF Transcript_35939/g.68921 Transcript_35939/m.68921 type:complete len:162 (-) Transcript_35939:429-914(-)